METILNLQPSILKRPELNIIQAQDTIKSIKVAMNTAVHLQVQKYLMNGKGATNMDDLLAKATRAKCETGRDYAVSRLLHEQPGLIHAGLHMSFTRHWQDHYPVITHDNNLWYLYSPANYDPGGHGEYKSYNRLNTIIIGESVEDCLEIASPLEGHRGTFKTDTVLESIVRCKSLVHPASIRQPLIVVGEEGDDFGPIIVNIPFFSDLQIP